MHNDYFKKKWYLSLTTTDIKQKALKDANEKLLADNARLTDYNNKLFMRITEPVEDKPAEKELTAEEKEAQQIDEILKLMKDRRI